MGDDPETEHRVEVHREDPLAIFFLTCLLRVAAFERDRITRSFQELHSLVMTNGDKCAFGPRRSFHAAYASARAGWTKSGLLEFVTRVDIQHDDEEEPDNVDEGLVHRDNVDRDVRLRGVVAEQRGDEDDAQHDGTEADVEGGQAVERAGVGAFGDDGLMEDELVVPVSLPGEEPRDARDKDDRSSRGTIS